MLNKHLLSAYSHFQATSYPFLQELKKFFEVRRPYEGLKIIHNVHITFSTLCKIETLLYSGAQVTVTATSDLMRHPHAMDLLKQSKIHFVEEQDIKDDYDISLDCCAGLYGKVNPRLGAIELTQTGSAVYKSHPLTYPVISVDDSITKNIENFYGTGDGFLRGFRAFVKEDFNNKKFILFGYGKVGRGVAYHLRPFSSDILIIEKDSSKLTDALSNGYAGVYYDDVIEITKILKDAYCVITASGVSGLLSQLYDKKIFKDVSYFVNIGSHDEFGYKFSEAEVLYEKRPINFSLEEPTRMMFLDPVFYLHNLAGQTLLVNQRKPGVYSYPIDQDLEIVGRWSRIHKIDTTEVFQAKSLPAPSNLLENLLRYLPCYVYWKDTNSKYMGCNHLFAKAAGLESPTSIIGKTDFDLAWGKTEAELFQKSDQAALQGEYKINFIESQYQADGTTKMVLASKVPFYHPTGEVEGVLGIYVDITAQKQAEELRHQNILNQEKMETMRLLAASIAHEIRTPLAAINGEGSVVKTLLPTLLDAYQAALAAGFVKKPLRKSQLEFFKHLPEELSHITSSANVFIDMLLTKVNFESLKEKSLQLTRLDAKEAIMDAIHHYPLDEYSASLLTGNYKNSFEFMGDAVLFQHVVFNLLKNAVYYVRATGRQGEINIWFEQHENQNIIHFKDTGKGISPDVLPNIFNSFYTRSCHGTGVGLAFCKMIIESFGGDICCESIENQYTHFMLCFPKIIESMENNK